MAMNKGFAAYLAKKKMPGDKKEDASSMQKVAKRHSKVMIAPKKLKHGKYL